MNETEKLLNLLTVLGDTLAGLNRKKQSDNFGTFRAYWRNKGCR